ncbi:MAG TPA: hypothetical protein PL096_12035 [Micropepsaceae bacterium]|nr:hypothetical protein [Micropepsaceae bacterium]
MPRKPTTTYGHIAFSKSGKVRKHTYRLSDDKRKQEEEVANQFCKSLGSRREENIKYRMLDERDHDFLLLGNNYNVFVQITEIAQREYLTPLDHHAYLLGQSGFTEFYVGEDGKMSGVDSHKRDSMIRQRIADKCAKNYAKPTGNELWLLIFSSDSMLSPVVYQTKTRIELPSLLAARSFCALKGCEPFDQIWFMALGLPPNKIWPHE